MSQVWQPHRYQVDAAKFLVSRPHAALFLDPGLGKTSITLAALSILFRHGVRKILVIAPLRVCYGVWPAEIEKWRDFESIRCAILHGRGKEQALQEPADIYVINPEGLAWLLNAKKVKTKKGREKIVIDQARWDALKFDTLVIDELSKFKHPRAARFKMLKPILGSFTRRYGLTGSPASNGLLDLFGQCFVLDRGAALGEYISHYRARYFFQARHDQNYELRPGAEDEIHRAIAPLALRVSDIVLDDMPEQIDNVIPVTLPADAKEAYKKMEKKLIVEIENKTVTAANAAAGSMKCRQIANGSVYVDDADAPLFGLAGKADWVRVHNAKLEALENLIDELQGSPILVAYEFQHDLMALHDWFGDDVGYIGGGLRPGVVSAIVDRWNAGEIPVLFAQPQTIGHGMNLQGCGAQHVCFYSLSWNFELYDQFIRRVRRQGNAAGHVYVHHIIATGTIDRVVLQVLRSKNRTQQALLDAVAALGDTA